MFDGGVRDALAPTFDADGIATEAASPPDEDAGSVMSPPADGPPSQPRGDAEPPAPAEADAGDEDPRSAAASSAACACTLGGRSRPGGVVVGLLVLVVAGRSRRARSSAACVMASLVLWSRTP
jgi:hypothetical protein